MTKEQKKLERKAIKVMERFARESQKIVESDCYTRELSLKPAFDAMLQANRWVAGVI